MKLLEVLKMYGAELAPVMSADSTRGLIGPRTLAHWEGGTVEIIGDGDCHLTNFGQPIAVVLYPNTKGESCEN